ncbi:11092_t:CDS:1, partial [Racocetra fulgida]
NATGLYDFVNSSSELRNSGMTYADDLISEQERSLKLLEKIIQETSDNKQD